MKRGWIIALALVAVIAGGGYFAFEKYKIYIPGFLMRLREPIGPAREIEWAQGPEAAPAAGAPRPPNIIVILADDLGYNDLTWNGGGVADGRVPTPNIDSLARDGASVDQAYAANATCSPSRAAIMTGRYPTRFGFEFTAVPMAFARNLAHTTRETPYPPRYFAERERDMPPPAEMGMPASEITIAELLQANGYHTIHIGKWHLGEAPAMRPNAQGFDESLGFLSGAGMFLPANDPNVVNSKQDFDPIDRFLWANLPYAVRWNDSAPFRPTGYITDYFADEAVRAIQANRNRPFFMYLAFNAPHTPLQATREDYDALSDIDDHTLRVYGGMIRSLDRGVGRVLEALRANGLEENTLVIFTSDNGGANYIGLTDINRPFRGWKATFFEGGTRVPFFARWPARLPAGARIPGPASHFDIYSTAAAAAGVPVPSDRVIDGVDLAPYLRGERTTTTHDIAFWRSGHYNVVRQGDWKLQVSERPQRVWLFNLAVDPTEQHDLSAQEPERVAALRALIDAHNGEMPRPIWPALVESPVRIDVPLNAPFSEGEEYIYWAN